MGGGSATRGLCDSSLRTCSTTSARTSKLWAFQKYHSESESETQTERIRPGSHTRCVTAAAGAQRFEMSVTTPPSACEMYEPQM